MQVGWPFCKDFRQKKSYFFFIHFHAWMPEVIRQWSCNLANSWQWSTIGELLACKLISILSGDHSYRWFKIIKKKEKKHKYLKIIDHHHWIYSYVQFSKYILITSTTVQIYLPRNFPHFKYISIFFYYISVLPSFSNSLILTIIAFHHVFSPLNEEDQEFIYFFFLFLSFLHCQQYWKEQSEWVKEREKKCET